jgi:hypothetical protein
MSDRKEGAKDHHTIPRCYLNSWTDISTPKDQTPYLWVADLEAARVFRRAPKNVFVENDFYLIKGKDGARDLRLENGLRGLEDRFVRIQRETLERRQTLKPDQAIELAMFVAAMRFRTKSIRDHVRALVQKMIRDVSAVESRLTNVSMENSGRFVMIRRGSRSTRREASIDDLRRVAETPMAPILLAGLEVWTTALVGMTASVLCTDDKNGFITSDNPCVLIDLSRPRPHPLFPPIISDKHVQLTLPISSRMALVYSHKESAPFYIDATPDFVEILNSRTATYAGSEYVASTEALAKNWLDEYLVAKRRGLSTEQHEVAPN